MSKISKQQPAQIGSLEPGDWFIHDSKYWEVVEKRAAPSKAKMRCRQVNTPVILEFDRNNYVLLAPLREVSRGT